MKTSKLTTNTTYHIFEFSSEGHFKRPTSDYYGREQLVFSEYGYDSEEEAAHKILQHSETIDRCRSYFIMPQVTVVRLE